MVLSWSGVCGDWGGIKHIDKRCTNIYMLGLYTGFEKHNNFQFFK